MSRVHYVLIKICLFYRIILLLKLASLLPVLIFLAILICLVLLFPILNFSQPTYIVYHLPSSNSCFVFSLIES